MELLLTIIFFVPGMRELAVATIIWLIGCAVLRKISWKPWPTALLFTSIIFLVISNLVEFKPWFLVLYGVCGIISYQLMGANRRNSINAKLSLPIVATVFAIMFWQYTFVEREIVVPATWEISERTPSKDGGPLEDGHSGQDLVTLNFNLQQFTQLYSDELSTYLRSQPNPVVTVTLSLLYHGGRFAGHSVYKIDGKEFTSDGGGTGSDCRGKCIESIFPTYYLGLRGF